MLHNKDLHKALKYYAVRQVLWEILEYAGTFGTVTNRDPYLMAAASGRRDIGLWLLSTIEDADENVFFKMKKEAKERIEEYNRQEMNTEDTEENV